jgi:hypothetical protein
MTQLVEQIERLERQAASWDAGSRACVNYIGKFARDSSGNLRLISRLSRLHAIDEDGYSGSEGDLMGLTLEEYVEDADDAVAILAVWEIMLEMRTGVPEAERMFDEVAIIVNTLVFGRRRDG